MGFEREVAVLRQAEVMRAQLERIEECLDALSYEDRLVLDIVADWEGEKIMRICDALRVSEPTAYRRKRGALIRISELFKENMVIKK